MVRGPTGDSSAGDSKTLTSRRKFYPWFIVRPRILRAWIRHAGLFFTWIRGASIDGGKSTHWQSGEGRDHHFHSLEHEVGQLWFDQAAIVCAFWVVNYYILKLITGPYLVHWLFRNLLYKSFLRGFNRSLVHVKAASREIPRCPLLRLGTTKRTINRSCHWGEPYNNYNYAPSLTFQSTSRYHIFDRHLASHRGMSARLVP